MGIQEICTVLVT